MNLAPKVKSYTVKPPKKRSHALYGFMLVFIILAASVLKVALYSIPVEASSGTLTFAPAVGYTTGTNPSYDLFSGPVSADVNKDGHVDLITTNVQSNTVSVFLGRGDGTFASKVDYATGNSPMQSAVQDINHDTYPDIVVANGSTPNSVSVLLNNGNGTFAAKVDYSVGVNNPLYGAPHLADFDKDGNLDIAISSNASSSGFSVIVLRGNGNGTFKAAEPYITGNNSGYDLTIADFNNDTYPDIAVPSSPNCGGASNDPVKVILNNGDGTFAAPTAYNVGRCPYISIVTADLNHDGYLDIAINNEQGSNVSVLINNGNGTFAAAVNYPVGSATNSIASADLNGDGSPDLVIGDAGVSVLINNGNGTFASSVNYPIGNSSYSIPALIDFNRDGKLDLVVINFGDNNISVAQGNGSGTFAAAVNYPVAGGTGPEGVLAIGDFNEDGLSDFALTSSGGTSMSVYVNTTQLPSVAFASASGSGAESVTSPVIPVTLESARDVDVTVNYAVTGGTASGGGNDYSLTSGALTIPHGQTSANIPLSVVDDPNKEPDETVQITLSSPTNAPLGTNTTYTYTIINDDFDRGGGGAPADPGSPPANQPQANQPPVNSPPTNTQQPPSNSVPSQNPVSNMFDELTSPAIRFLRNLFFGSVGQDVKQLQIFLNNNGFMVATTGPGSPGHETTYYGPKTEAAVKRFQEAYKDQILVPAGLTSGTGYFGFYTRSFINSLLNR